MNLTSFLQEKQLTIALRGEIDHHTARDILRVVSNKIDLYLLRACWTSARSRLWIPAALPSSSRRCAKCVS